MTTQKVIRLAREHMDDKPENAESARLCLADAVHLYDEGNIEAARRRALKSLMYSVSLFHPIFDALNALDQNGSSNQVEEEE